MKIISRYLLKEHVGPFLFSCTALTSIMLLQYIARRFGDLVGKGLSWWVILKFFLLSVPFTVAMTLPMAVLVAVLYAFSRLAAENEITALKAGGVSMKTLMLPTLGAGVGMAVLMLLFNDQVLPRSNHALAQLQTDIFNTKPTFALKPQVINTLREGQLYIRANHLDEGSSRMSDVTVYDLSDPTRRRTIYADSGFIEVAPNKQDIIMTLRHGEMQTLEAQRESQLTRLFYARDRVLVKDIMKGFSESTGDSAQKSDREMSVCEMQTALQKNDGALQTYRYQLARAQWALNRSKGGKEPEPKKPDIRPTYGIGGLYCSLAARFEKLVMPKEAKAELPGRGTRPALQDTTKRDTTRKKSPADSLRQLATMKRQADSARRVDSLKILEARRNGMHMALPPQQPVAKPPAPLTVKTVGTPAGAVPATINPANPAAAVPAVATPPSLGGTDIEVQQAKLNVESARYYVSRYSIEIQKKFALAAACIVFVLLGAPIALRFPRGGVGLVIGVSFLIFAIYYVGLIAGESMANKNIISPFWAMWAANVLFSIVAALLLSRMGREASTSRGGDWREAMSNVRARVGRLFHRRSDAADTAEVPS